MNNQLGSLLALIAAAALCFQLGVAHAAQIEFPGGEHATPRGSLTCGSSESGQITVSDPAPFTSGGVPLHADNFSFTLASRQVVTLNTGAALYTRVYFSGGSPVTGFVRYEQSAVLNAGDYTVYVVQGSTTQVLPVDYTLNITCAPENPMASAAPGSLTVMCSGARAAGSGKLPLFAEPMEGLNARGDEEFEEVVTLDPATLYELTASSRTRTLSGIPLGDGTVDDFLLTPYEVFTADAEIYGFDGQNKAHLPKPDVQFYEGTSTKDPDAHLILSVTNGIEGRLTLRRPGLPPMAMTPVDTHGSGLHLLSRVTEFDSSRPLCEGEVVVEQPPDNRKPFLLPQEERGTGTLDSGILVDVANYAYVNAFGSSTSAATTYMANLYGAVSGIYLRDTNNLIRIRQLVVWTAADPIDGASTSTQLANYRTYNMDNRPMATFPRVIAQFMSTKPGLGGRAYLNALCSTNSGYGVNNIHGTNSFPNPNEYIWDINVLAHEMGHNFGSSHTHCYSPPIDCCYSEECGCTQAPQVGTVMSYCHLVARISMNFHQRVIDNIRPRMENAACIQAYVPEGANYFVVTNSGNAPLTVNIALETPQPWLTFSQTSFTLNARAKHQVTVEVDCVTARGDTTNHTIQITGNATNGMQSIPLTVMGLGGGPTPTPTATPTPIPTATPTATPVPTATPTPTPCPMSSELLINGDFDLGRNVGWMEVNEGFNVIDENGFPHSGDYHCFFGGYFASSEETVSQAVVLPQDSNPILSFYMNVNATQDSPDNRLEVRVDGTPVRTFLHAESQTIKAYTQFTVPLAAYADGGAHTIDFHALTGEATSATWFVDTVSLTACVESLAYDSTDTDLDGFTDQIEIQYMSNPLDPDSVPDFGNYDSIGATNAGDALGLYRDQAMRGISPPSWDVDNDGDVDLQDAITLWRWSIGRPGYEVIPMAPPEER